MKSQNNNIISNLCGDMIEQILNLLLESDKSEEIKKKLIDPLVDYYRFKLFFFYGLITFLLLIVIFSNFYIIYKLSR